MMASGMTTEMKVAAIRVPSTCPVGWTSPATWTVNGAAILGMEKKLGRIAPGYFADIVAVEGNPLDDIRVAIDKVKWVMKAGTVVVDRR